MSHAPESPTTIDVHPPAEPPYVPGDESSASASSPIVPPAEEKEEESKEVEIESAPATTAPPSSSGETESFLVGNEVAEEHDNEGLKTPTPPPAPQVPAIVVEHEPEQEPEAVAASEEGSSASSTGSGAGEDVVVVRRKDTAGFEDEAKPEVTSESAAVVSLPSVSGETVQVPLEGSLATMSVDEVVEAAKKKEDMETVETFGSEEALRDSIRAAMEDDTVLSTEAAEEKGGEDEFKEEKKEENKEEKKEEDNPAPPTTGLFLDTSVAGVTDLCASPLETDRERPSPSGPADKSNDIVEERRQPTASAGAVHTDSESDSDDDRTDVPIPPPIIPAPQRRRSTKPPTKFPEAPKTPFSVSIGGRIMTSAGPQLNGPVGDQRRGSPFVPREGLLANKATKGHVRHLSREGGRVLPVRKSTRHSYKAPSEHSRSRSRSPLPPPRNLPVNNRETRLLSDEEISNSAAQARRGPPPARSKVSAAGPQRKATLPNPLPVPGGKLSVAQLVIQLRDALAAESTFYYTLKGVLAEYEESNGKRSPFVQPDAVPRPLPRFGIPQGNWARPPPHDSLWETLSEEESASAVEDFEALRAAARDARLHSKINKDKKERHHHRHSHRNHHHGHEHPHSHDVPRRRPDRIERSRPITTSARDVPPQPKEKSHRHNEPKPSTSTPSAFPAPIPTGPVVPPIPIRVTKPTAEFNLSDHEAVEQALGLKRGELNRSAPPPPPAAQPHRADKDNEPRQRPSKSSMKADRLQREVEARRREDEERLARLSSEEEMQRLELEGLRRKKDFLEQLEREQEAVRRAADRQKERHRQPKESMKSDGRPNASFVVKNFSSFFGPGRNGYEDPSRFEELPASPLTKPKLAHVPSFEFGPFQPRSENIDIAQLNKSATAAFTSKLPEATTSRKHARQSSAASKAQVKSFAGKAPKRRHTQGGVEEKEKRRKKLDAKGKGRARGPYEWPATRGMSFDEDDFP
ncbi:hypothetical protein MNV49_004400 [Pseudohyphozyma bogoriensis]|nr:hypothetical protein MNV49_004400 [Pseudohyphozyma bogoriensis]